MKSIEIKVPRNLIQKFYPHPEPYGDGDINVKLRIDKSVQLRFLSFIVFKFIFNTIRVTSDIKQIRVMKNNLR